MIHVVRKGESIWSISRMYRVSVDTLLESNGIRRTQKLVIGQAIVIPAAKEKNYGFVEINGFIQPSTSVREDEILNDTARYMTYLTAFSHHVNADGSLAPLDDNHIMQKARQARAASMMSVTNLSGANFDTELIHGILQSQNLQGRLIQNIKAMVQQKGYYGVIVDFERIPPQDRTSYNDFLRNLVSAMHPRYAVATALAPKTYDITEGAWHGAHDYRAHGRIVDFSVIMTYEWGWSGGPPMAVAPLNEVAKVIRYAVSVMPAKKIMMGMPLYGYDWTLPYVPGGEFAESIGNDEAVRRASKYNAEIKYDMKAQSPYYFYRDEGGKQHEVWFEDARSVLAKYRLLSRYGLRGASYWVLSQPFVQNFTVLDDMFKITKVVK